MNTVYWINQIMSTMYTNNSAEFWVGLSSTAPARDGSGVAEPTCDDYERAQLVGFSEPIDGYVYNKNDVEFVKTVSDWFPSETKAAYWILFDGKSSDANVLSSGELEKAKTVESDVRVILSAATLGITLLDYEAASLE